MPRESITYTGKYDIASVHRASHCNENGFVAQASAIETRLFPKLYRRDDGQESEPSETKSRHDVVVSGEPAVSTFVVIVHHETPPRAERTPQRMSQAAGTPILGLFGQRTLDRLITLRIRPCLFLSSGECLVNISLPPIGYLWRW